jgi:acyl-CoA synthetase (AMP-forming)/AMP-acid ligase II
MNNVISAIANTAHRNPSKLALICSDRTLSFGELEVTTNKLARQLLKNGLKAGDRLAIHWSNSIESVELFIACAKAGIVIVPLNTVLKAPEVGFLFKDSEISACFSEPRFAAISNEAARISLVGFPDS